jgi:CRP/FNR family transcriptional regulator, cyclic AMP receptor protein
MSAIELVKNCPLFFEMYDDEVLNFIENFNVETYKGKSYIVKQGEEGESLYIILDGDVEILVNSKENEKILITELGPGDFFGELVLINEKTRTADVRAIKEVSVLEITLTEFYKYFDSNPKLFSLMVLNISRLLTRRLKNSDTIIADLKKSKL